MQTFCFYFLDPQLVDGVAELADPEARRDAMLEIIEDDRVTAWAGIRIRGPELDRTIASLETIFGFAPDELALPLLAGEFPGAIPQQVPTFSYVDPFTTRRLAERLAATAEQDEKIDEDGELARVYEAFVDPLQAAARRGLAVVAFADG